MRLTSIILVVTMLASAILFIGLPIVVRDVIIPRSVLVIDFLLFTFLLIGSRVSFAALNETFVRLQSRWQPHVLSSWGRPNSDTGGEFTPGSQTYTM